MTQINNLKNLNLGGNYGKWSKETDIGVSTL